MSLVDHLRDKFHIITPVSNPVRYSSRYRLYREFEQRMKAANVQLHTIELQNGERKFAVTEHGNPYHIQVRTDDELWSKENLINIAVRNLTEHWPDWKYVAWVDADVEFTRPDWVHETINELQVSHWVQMFQTAIDLGPAGESTHTHHGFVYSWFTGRKFNPGYSSWHPGFAWAATRHAFCNVGGLIDRAILGSADRHMAMALIGRGQESFNTGVHPNYKHMVAAWQGRADRYVKRDIGYVRGTLLHHWHGRKALRGYRSRWQILVDNQYDPYVDVYPECTGVLRLEDDRLDLRDAIKRYFRSRNEDSIDIE